MLVELSLQDLALFEQAELVLGPGLNAITGETGAGKSLIVDALELLLGRRARAEVVRAGARRARVEGRFLLSVDSWGQGVARWLEEHLPDTLEEWREEQGTESEPAGELELVLTRTITRDGRSRAHVNHRPVTGKLLRELATQLVEIHGQHEHQRLFEPAEQLQLLDTFAGLGEALAGYRERRAAWLGLRERLEGREAEEQRRAERLDLIEFQLSELEALDLDAVQPEDLRSERELLRNAAELATALGGLVEGLAEQDGAALEIVQRAERVLDGWCARIPSMEEAAGCVREASAQLEAAAGLLRTLLDAAEPDPARLEELEEQLVQLERLARKHGVGLQGLAARRDALEEERARLQAERADSGALEEQEARARTSADQAAARLTKERMRHLKRLAEAVTRGLGELGLERARFEAQLTPHGSGEEGGLEGSRRRLGASGAEGVEFLLAANPGERMGPLRRVASGGEAARILLALRGALAVRQSTPTLVFDEVDAGVGGRLGPRVAAHLGALGAHHQVVVVTHLPSIAAAASRHLRVAKEVEGGRTRTGATALSGEARVAEVADMIAGGAEAATARAEARRLLGEDA
jgi:DNA repair protein RecN (Recombination protein N)